MQRLDEEWTAGRVVTLDVMDTRIREYGDSVGFEVTPTFILYDAAGSEVRRWVGHTPTLGELRDGGQSRGMNGGVKSSRNARTPRRHSCPYCQDYMFGAPFAQLNYRLPPSSEPDGERMNLVRSPLSSIVARTVARLN